MKHKKLYPRFAVNYKSVEPPGPLDWLPGFDRRTVVRSEEWWKVRSALWAEMQKVHRLSLPHRLWTS